VRCAYLSASRVLSDPIRSNHCAAAMRGAVRAGGRAVRPVHC
jgi:hypothetical protein